MRNTIIKLLGGFTREEYDSLGVQFDSKVEDWQKLIATSHEYIVLKDNEIQRLTDLMLTRSGFISEAPNTSGSKEAPRPLNNRLSWRAMQKEYELTDARRHADEVEQRWKAKQAAQSQEGTGSNEQVPDTDFIAS